MIESIECFRKVNVYICRSAVMPKFLGICSNYAIDHSLTYNTKKVIHGTLKFGSPAQYIDVLLSPNVSECKYLVTNICQKEL